MLVPGREARRERHRRQHKGNKQTEDNTQWVELRKQLGNDVVFDDPAMRAQWPKGTRTKKAKAKSQAACAHARRLD